MTKVMRRSGEESSKSFLAAFCIVVEGSAKSWRICSKSISAVSFRFMCGRFTLKSPGRTKFARLYPSHLPPLLPRYNIAPSQSVLAIIQGAEEPEAVLFQCGLIPSWSKEAKGFINARAETLEEKPSFKESFQRRRCLIPADGFYEAHRKNRAALLLSDA